MAKRYATNISTPNGRVYVSAKTKEEFERKKQDVRAAMRSGVNFKASDTTVREVAELWLRVYKAPPLLRESSYAVVRQNTQKHVIGFFGDMLIKDVRPAHVQMFLRSIAGLGKSAQTKCIQHAKAIFDVAVSNDIIVKSPFTKNDKPSAGEPEDPTALTNEQAKALLSATRGTRAYLFCLLALSTGMRRGEILGLMWDDVDLEQRAITVRHNLAYISGRNESPVTELLKTDAARRVLPISGLLVEALVAAQVESSSPYVFHRSNGKPLTRSSFVALWSVAEKRARKEAVFVDGFTCHPHQLRHTFCTVCIESGMAVKDVQYLMGHATPDITMRVYSHYRHQSRAAMTAQLVNDAVCYLT